MIGEHTDMSRGGSRQAALTRLRGFRVEQWDSWLQSFYDLWLHRLEGACPPEPAINVGGEELDAVLAGLYEDLTDRAARDCFAQAVLSLYKSTEYRDENAHLFHQLMLLMPLVKPLGAERLLRRDLIDEAFLSLRPRAPGWVAADDGVRSVYDLTPVKLHTLLLSVMEEFGPDDATVNYVRESARRIDAHPYLLTCFRLLASDGDKESFAFIEEIIPHTRTDAEADELAGEVSVELERPNGRFFHEWYAARASALAYKYPEAFHLFEERLLERLPRAGESGTPPDPHIELLGLQLRAGRVRYSAQELVQIARLHHRHGVELMTHVMRNIWRRATPLCHDKLPWIYMGRNEQFASSIHTVGTVLVKTREVSLERFDRAAEPNLELIFEKITSVKQFGEPLGVREERMEEAARLRGRSFSASVGGRAELPRETQALAESED